MITRETAALIWECHREIAAGKQLLKDLQQAAKDFHGDVRQRSLTDVFGRQRELELGVPSGQSSHRLYNVAPGLAESVIRAHIANKRAELAAANETARIEIDLPSVEVEPADESEESGA